MILNTLEEAEEWVLKTPGARWDGYNIVLATENFFPEQFFQRDHVVEVDNDGKWVVPDENV